MHSPETQALPASDESLWGDGSGECPDGQSVPQIQKHVRCDPLAKFPSQSRVGFMRLLYANSTVISERCKHSLDVGQSCSGREGDGLWGQSSQANDSNPALGAVRADKRKAVACFQGRSGHCFLVTFDTSL